MYQGFHRICESVFWVVSPLLMRSIKATGGQEAVSSSLATRTMQSVLIGSEYPVMDTLLFYVENGEKPKAIRRRAQEAAPQKRGCLLFSLHELDQFSCLGRFSAVQFFGFVSSGASPARIAS